MKKLNTLIVTFLCLFFSQFATAQTRRIVIVWVSDGGADHYSKDESSLRLLTSKYASDAILKMAFYEFAYAEAFKSIKQKDILGYHLKDDGADQIEQLEQAKNIINKTVVDKKFVNDQFVIEFYVDGHGAASSLTGISYQRFQKTFIEQLNSRISFKMVNAPCHGADLQDNMLNTLSSSGRVCGYAIAAPGTMAFYGETGNSVNISSIESSYQPNISIYELSYFSRFNLLVGYHGISINDNILVGSYRSKNDPTLTSERVVERVLLKLFRSSIYYRDDLNRMAFDLSEDVKKQGLSERHHDVNLRAKSRSVRAKFLKFFSNWEQRRGKKISAERWSLPLTRRAALEDIFYIYATAEELKKFEALRSCELEIFGPTMK